MATKLEKNVDYVVSNTKNGVAKTSGNPWQFIKLEGAKDITLWSAEGSWNELEVGDHIMIDDFVTFNIRAAKDKNGNWKKEKDIAATIKWHKVTTTAIGWVEDDDLPDGDLPF